MQKHEQAKYDRKSTEAKKNLEAENVGRSILIEEKPDLLKLGSLEDL